MKIFLIALILFFIPSAHAQQLDKKAIPFSAKGTVETISPIREAPPHGPFNLFLGEEIKSTIQGQEVEIIGKKTYSGFSGTHVWYQLKSAGGQSADHDKPWWIYGGLEGKTPQIRIDNIKQ